MTSGVMRSVYAPTSSTHTAVTSKTNTANPDSTPTSNVFMPRPLLGLSLVSAAALKLVLGAILIVSAVRIFYR
jgi:hypothetical protein